MAAVKATGRLDALQWPGNGTADEMMAIVEAGINDKEAVAFTA